MGVLVAFTNDLAVVDWPGRCLAALRLMTKLLSEGKRKLDLEQATDGM